MEFWPLKTLSEVSGVLLGLQLSPTLNMGVHLGVWGFTPSHSLHSREHVIWLPDLLIGLQPCNPLAFVASQGQGYDTHSFKTIIRFSFYFPFFSPLLSPIIIFLFKKLVGINVQDWMKIFSNAKREPPMIQVRFLKRRKREVKVDSKLGGQWKVPCLVANGMFQA